MKSTQRFSLFSIIFSIILFNGNCKNQSNKSTGDNTAESALAVTTLADISSLPGIDEAANQMPQGIATDGINIFVTDFFNNTVLRVSMTSGKVSPFSGVSGVSGFNDGAAKTALFNRPFGIVALGGFLYVADSGNSVIRKISIADGSVTTFAGKPFVAGHLNGPLQKALLRFPFGVTTDGKSLYVADSGNSTIRKIDLANRQVSTVAGMAGVAGFADGRKELARFNTPKGIATDGINVYVADTINGAVRKVVIATGDVSTLAGKDFQPGGSDGKGVEARFNNPVGAVMMGDSLYIADAGNNNIRKINPLTGEVVTVAGKRGYDSNCPTLILYQKLISKSEKEINSDSADGPGTESRFKSPAGIATDGKNLYVADTKNSLVRMLK